MTATSVEVFALLTQKDAQRAQELLPQAKFTQMAMACEPDNMLVNEFQQREGRPPIAESLYRIELDGADAALGTGVIVEALPQGAYWYGSSR
ncbi:hypothetical protein [Corynebacterium kozikiae]|uniref:hypothetical protein n=1 Tax=Corynebacterium kozikiae TaxID=2968469 RepID=UPI00211C9CDC|nr:hypothetical protein [Corynebacterium sp. 76QC2CO]MCQ9342367.1 hypothetical protein [Corynebacterium sp. 76QC2CO]